MGCFTSKSDEPKIRIYDCAPPGDDSARSYYFVY